MKHDHKLCSVIFSLTAVFFVTDPTSMTAAISHNGFTSSLSRSISESQTRFAITIDNVQELNMSFNKNTMQISDATKLKRQSSNVRPAVSKPFNDKVA